MLSPFSCRIPYQPGTSLRVLELRPPIWVKRFGSWKCTPDTSRSKVDVARVHILSLMANYHQHPPCPPSDKRWYKDDSSLMLGTNNAPCNGGNPRPSASREVTFTTTSEDMNQMEPPGGSCSFSLNGLPAWALTVSIVFGGQPACADFKPPVRQEVGVKMEVMSSSVPSVETILAKQLALRFRQMSDEELVDILQQLLKASRSSLSPRDTADDGIVPEDLFIKKDSGQLDMKSAEGIRKKLGVPKTKESNANIDENVRSGHSGTQPADSPGKEGFDQRIGDKTSFQEEANVQVDKKILEKAKVTETQGEHLPMDWTPAENINGDAKHSQSQKTKDGGNGAFTLPQTAEVIPGDAFQISKSSESDLTGPTELPSRTPDLNTAEGSGEDENVTALLWAEWSRRASGEVVQNSQSSNTSVNVVDFWQNVQVYSTNVAREVVALTALVFDHYKVVVGIFTMWCIFVVLAFKLGRFRASSRRDVSNSEAAIQEESYKASALPMEGELRFKNDQLQDEKWWKRPSIGLFLSGTEQAPTQSIWRTSDQSLARSIPGARGRLDQEVDYPSNTLRNRTRPELASFLGRGSEGVHVSSSQMEQLKEIQDGQEVVDGSKGTFYPSMSAVASLVRDSGEVQVTGRQHRGQRHVDQVDANVQDKGEGYLAGEEWHQGKTIISDRNGTSAALEHAFISTSGGLNRDHRVATSPVEVVQDAEDTATGSYFEFQSTSSTQIHQKQADGHQENTSSRVFVQEGLGFKERVNQTDGLKGASAKQPGANNASCRGDKYATANLSKSDLNSFVHDCVLFVRDADGVFIQQTDSKEDRDSSKVRESLRVPQDIPDSSRPDRSSWNAGSEDLQSPVSSKTLRKGAQNGFDYRLLIIDSSKKHQQELGTVSRESGTDGHAQQMWPLRYSSDGQKILKKY